MSHLVPGTLAEARQAELAWNTRDHSPRGLEQLSLGPRRPPGCHAMPAYPAPPPAKDEHFLQSHQPLRIAPVLTPS